MTVIDCVTSLIQCGIAITIGLLYFTFCMWCTSSMTSSLDNDSDTRRSDGQTTQFCTTFDVSLAVASFESKFVAFGISKALFHETKYVASFSFVWFLFCTYFSNVLFFLATRYGTHVLDFFICAVALIFMIDTGAKLNSNLRKFDVSFVCFIIEANICCNVLLTWHHLAKKNVNY